MACVAPAAPLTLTLLTPVVYVGSTCTVWTIKAREIGATCTVNDSKARNEICSYYLLLTAYLLTAYCLLLTKARVDEICSTEGLDALAAASRAAADAAAAAAAGSGAGAAGAG